MGPTFGTRVRQQRLELKLSQEKLANKLGLDRGTIIDYEKDRYLPRTVEARKALAEALELSPDALYGNVEFAQAEQPVEAVSLGLNFGQLRRSFKKTSGQQLRDWKRVFKYLLNHAELTVDDYENVLRCVTEITEIRKQRKRANRGGGSKAEPWTKGE